MGLSRVGDGLGFPSSLGWGEKAALPCLAVKPALKKSSFLWEGASCSLTPELIAALRSCPVCGQISVLGRPARILQREPQWSPSRASPPPACYPDLQPSSSSKITSSNWKSANARSSCSHTTQTAPQPRPWSMGRGPGDGTLLHCNPQTNVSR